MSKTDRGKLFYLVGPSGSGKDSLLDYLKAQVDRTKVKFPRRYITRPASAGGESHIEISKGDFLRQLEEEFFVFWWESHGNYYGLSYEIEDWLAAGCQVVMNGSRGYLPKALEVYPEMVTVLVEVSDEVLRERLTGRGRERATEIEKRIQRNMEFADFSAPNLLRLNNDRPLSISGQELLKLIWL